MTLPTYGRTRTLIIPDFSGSNVLLGKFYRGKQVGGVYTGQYESVAEASFFYNYHANRFWTKAQVCMDTVHKGPPYRSGDAFSCLKYDWSTPYTGVHGSGTYERRDKSAKYVGGFKPPSDYSPLGVDDKFAFWANPMSVLLRTTNNTNHPSMAGLDLRAWKSTKPKLQKADAGIFTAELRDMPRMLKSAAKRYDQIWRAMGGTYTSKKEVLKGGIRLMQPKKIADDFLSQQFGWVPFVKDLIKFDNVVQNYHDIIARSIARNDRWVRRRVNLQATDEITNIRGEAANRCSVFGFDELFYQFSSQTPTYTVQESKQTVISAVGKFRYYRPEFDVSVQDKLSQWNQAQQFLTVSGFRITPTNLYNAFPWTWAIDWFSNVGDWVDRLNDTWVDSIVSEYCFVMQHQKSERFAVQQIPFVSGPLTLRFSRTIDSKQRLKGSSPYGFDLSWDNLSPTQLAIAAALGIGRFPKIAQ